MKAHIVYITLLFSLHSFGQIKQNKKKPDPNITSFETKHGKDPYTYFIIPDTNYSAYKLPDSVHKPAKWSEKERARKSEWHLDYYTKYPDSINFSVALSYIDTAKAFDKVCMAKSWCIDNYQICFPYLVARLSYKIKVGLNNMADLIISDRMNTGDLTFYGHGGGMEEDIFTISGRASWILNDLTGENFAVVHGRLTGEEAQNYKILWMKYVEALKK